MSYACLISIALQGSASQTVTAEIAPTTVKKAFVVIASQLEKPLLVEGKIADEIVAIHVHDLSKDDLKKHLATATGGVWVDHEGKEVLTLPDWLDKRQQEEADRLRTEALLKAQADRKPLPPMSRAVMESWMGQLEVTVREMQENYMRNYEAFDRARQRHFDLVREGPLSRLLERILAKMDLREFANMEMGEQICLSDTPNHTERRIPFDIKPLLAQFADEQKLLKTVAPFELDQPAGISGDSRMWVLGADPEVSRVLLVATRHASSSGPAFNLRVLDREGWITGSIGIRLQPASPPPSASAKAEEGKIKLSEQTMTWRNINWWLRTVFEKDEKTGRPFRELLEPHLPILLHPDQTDPLLLAAGDTMADYAKHLGKNLVVLLPDRALKPTYSNETEIEVSALESTIDNVWKSERVDEGDTIVIRPKVYGDQRAERMNREALGRFFRQVHQAGTVTVADAAAYLWASPSRLNFEIFSYDEAAYGFGESIQGDYETKALTCWYHRASLKFLGSLSENQRRGLLSGGELTVAQLGSQARQEFARMVYSADSIESFFKPWVPNQTVRSILGHATSLVWERLPNGIPASTRIICEKAVEPVIITDESEHSLLTSYSPEWLGQDIVEREESPDRSNDRIVRLGQANVYRFRFVFSDSAEGKTTLGEIIPGKRQEIKSMDDLPADIRARVEKAMAAERKARLDKNQGTQGTPPPP